MEFIYTRWELCKYYDRLGDFAHNAGASKAWNNVQHQQTPVIVSATAPHSISMTTTTTVLRPLYRSACISWHVQLKTGDLRFCQCKVLLPTFLVVDGNQHIRTRKKMLEFSSIVLSTLSLYLDK